MSKTGNKLSWYGVRSFYRWSPPNGRQAYEERVVVFEASDPEEAIGLAEREAVEYVESYDDIEVLSEFQSFSMFDALGNRAEVFSLLRVSDLEPDAYIDRFFNTSEEIQTPVEE